jgi:hypothetical protein
VRGFPQVAGSLASMTTSRSFNGGELYFSSQVGSKSIVTSGLPTHGELLAHVTLTYWLLAGGGGAERASQACI